eukprot:gene29310-36483_t
MDSSALEQPQERVLQAGHAVTPACEYHMISAKRTDSTSALTATDVTEIAAVENANGALDPVRSDANTNAQTPVSSTTPLHGTAHKKLMKYANEKHGGVYENVIEEMLTMAATRARDVRDAAKAKKNAEKLEKQRARQLEKAAREEARAAK